MIKKITREVEVLAYSDESAYSARVWIRRNDGRFEYSYDFTRGDANPVHWHDVLKGVHNFKKDMALVLSLMAELDAA